MYTPKLVECVKEILKLYNNLQRFWKKNTIRCSSFYTSIYVNNINKPMFTCISLLNHLFLMTYVGILHITLD